MKTALLHPALRGASLAHAIGTCDVRLLLFERALEPALVSAELGEGVGCKLVCIDGEPSMVRRGRREPSSS